MYGYFANKSKHRLIVINIYKNMATYLINRTYICTDRSVFYFLNRIDNMTILNKNNLLAIKTFKVS